MQTIVHWDEVNSRFLRAVISLLLHRNEKGQAGSLFIVHSWIFKTVVVAFDLHEQKLRLNNNLFFVPHHAAAQ